MVDQPQLKGIRVLVVEDDDLSSLVAQEMLVELGCVVTGAERSVDGALATLENDSPFDCVMLDVRLRRAFKRHRHEAFEEGCSIHHLQRLRHQAARNEYTVLDKPYTVETLGRALALALAKRR